MSLTGCPVGLGSWALGSSPAAFCLLVIIGVSLLMVSVPLYLILTFTKFSQSILSPLDIRLPAASQPFRPSRQHLPCASLRRAGGQTQASCPCAPPALTHGPFFPHPRLPAPSSSLSTSDQNPLELRCMFSRLSWGSGSVLCSIWICLILISHKTYAFRISSGNETLVPPVVRMGMEVPAINGLTHHPLPPA